MSKRDIFNIFEYLRLQYIQGPTKSTLKSLHCITAFSDNTKYILKRIKYDCYYNRLNAFNDFA